MSPEDDEIWRIKNQLWEIERLKKEHHEKYERTFPLIESEYHKMRYKKASHHWCNRQRVRIKKLMKRLADLGETDFAIEKLIIKNIPLILCSTCRHRQGLYEDVNTWTCAVFNTCRSKKCDSYDDYLGGDEED
jgi:hypothetical protein